MKNPLPGTNAALRDCLYSALILTSASRAPCPPESKPRKIPEPDFRPPA